MSAAGLSTCAPCVAPPTELAAGPWTMILDSGDLRYIRWGTCEAVRRIYGAVRDENWDTVPPVIEGLTVKTTASGFEVRYAAVHQRGGIHFVWNAEITGSAEGVLRFVFDGEAKTSFRRNRIGLCVLLPQSAAGARARVSHGDGSRGDRVMPDLVEPAQPVPGFHDIAAMAFGPDDGRAWEVQFEGERFEMEDQRNWIDASFKIYGTPLHLPRPVEIAAGTRVRQVVTVRPESSPPACVVVGAASGSAPVEIVVGTDTHVLPAIGLCAASHGEAMSQREIECLRDLWLWHLRVDVRPSQPGWEHGLRLACAQAAWLHARVELALHVSDSSGTVPLAQVAEVLAAEGASLARVLVYHEGYPSTSGQALQLVRTAFRESCARIGVGTDADFYQLNQHRPGAEGADFVHWSMNPQVHAFDTRSLLETPAAIPAQVHSARDYFGRKPLVVSPVTLKPRFNPVALSAVAGAGPGALPPPVDPRQMLPCAAVWSLAAIKHLAEAGVESVTLFETTGWRGVMERDTGSPCPDLFRSKPGQMYPLYYALGLVTRFGGGRVISSRSSDALRVESLALVKHGWMAVVLCNMTATPQRACLVCPGQFSHRLDLDWSDERPEWRFSPRHVLAARGEPIHPVASHTLTLDLPAYGLVRIEVSR